MEDLKNKIPEIVDQYPDFAKGWIERRLNQEIDSTGQLPDKDTIRNIRDCLASLDEKSETIQKLNKIALKDMNTIQENWHKILAKKAEKLKEFGGKPFEYEPILKCDDGFQWVRLDTPEAKDYEGNAMGHCVGSGSYDSNKTIIYSLRDKNNIPHITVEFDERRKKFEQIQGKGNTKPNEKYYDDIVGLYKTTGANNYDELLENKTYAILNGKILVGDKAILSSPKDTVFDSVKLGSHSKIKNWKHSVSGDFNSDIYLRSINPDCTFGEKVNSYNTYAVLNGKVLFGDDAILSCPKDTVFDFAKVYKNSKIKDWNHNVKKTLDARLSDLESINPECEIGFLNLNNTYAILNGKILYGDDAISACPPGTVFDSVKLDKYSRIKEWNYSVKNNFVSNSSKLEFINPECVFGGDVYIFEAKIKEWHNDVGGNLLTIGSKVEKIVNCEIKGEIHCNNNVEIINEEKQVMRM